MDFKPLIKWLQNQIQTGFFWSKIVNPKDISDPIVRAIKDKEYETLDPDSISEPIVSALEDNTRAVQGIKIPEVTIPEVDFSPVTSALKELLAKKDKDVVIKQGDVNVKIDTDKILKVLKRIEEKKPKEQIDYTPILSDIYDIIEGKKEVDLSKVEKFIADFKFPELPLEDGRVKVTISDEELAKMRSRFFNSEQIRNKDNVQINPATTEDVENVVTALEDADPLSQYASANIDVSGVPIYLGFMTVDGLWYIKEINLTAGTVLYFKGSSDYATNWTNRAGLTYGTFNTIF